jgi:hypothetical protein
MMTKTTVALMMKGDAACARSWVIAAGSELLSLEWNIAIIDVH